MLPVNNLSLEEGNFNYSPIRNKKGDCKTTLKALRQENDNKLIVTHLNTNSLRNKFKLLCGQIKGTILF